MDVNDILKLVDAGFNKEEIKKLASAAEPPKAEPEAVKEEPPKAEPESPKEEAAKTDPAAELNAAVEKALKPFEDLYNNMAKLAVMPSIEKVEPKGIDDIIDNFFKGD